MDYSELDKVRRSAAPLQLDVVEAFAAGRLSRREFIQRATILGLSIGPIGMVIAACSGTTAVGRPERAARSRRQRWRQCRGEQRGQRGRHRRSPAARSGSPARSRCTVDPVAMQDLGGYGIIAQSFEFLCTLDRTDRSRHRARAWPRVGARTPTAPCGRSSCARASSGRTARTSPRTTSSPRWTAWSPPATPASRASSGRVARSPPTRTRSTFTLARRERQLPVPRLGLQRPDADHAEGLRGRARRSTR